MTERLAPKARSFQRVSFVSSLAGFHPPPPQAPRPARARGSASPDGIPAGGPRGACGPGVDSRGPGEEYLKLPVRLEAGRLYTIVCIAVGDRVNLSGELENHLRIFFSGLISFHF